MTSVEPARHGTAVPRGQRGLPASRGGRFGRMFADLPRPDPGSAAVEALVAHMASGGSGEDNHSVSAGYTYLGQFIDHDVTFDPASKLERDNDPDALVNFRTPRFDLDSLYGSGPADQPYLYDWSTPSHGGVKLLVGGEPECTPLASVDLPRNRQGRALIGDARNDENVIVSQLHLLFIRFHNRVVDRVRRDCPRIAADELFEQAQRIVRWHYQWIVTHDFLCKVVGTAMAASVLSPPAGSAPATRRRFYTWEEEPFLPVEFSGAAYRFGHSMVRRTYTLNGRSQSLPIFARSGTDGRHLGGLRRLPAELVIEWERFFAIGAAAPLPSMKIDHHIARALSHVPPGGASLPRLNLQRGRALGLPAGRDVACAMGVPPLTDAELYLDDVPADVVTAEQLDALLRATPLWYYVLCEARKGEAAGGEGGQHLGPVGGRIVAEVLVGLLEGDPHSYLRQQPSWTPELPGADGDFTMCDLVRFTRDD